MNGGVTSVTEFLYRKTGAPPSHGQQIEIGLEICKVLQAHSGVTTPVWVDGAEGYTGHYEMPCQVMRLYADKNADELQVVYADSGVDIFPTEPQPPLEVGPAEPTEDLSLSGEAGPVKRTKARSRT
jgi:hypothetical protein